MNSSQGERKYHFPLFHCKFWRNSKKAAKLILQFQQIITIAIYTISSNNFMKEIFYNKSFHISNLYDCCYELSVSLQLTEKTPFQFSLKVFDKFETQSVTKDQMCHICKSSNKYSLSSFYELNNWASDKLESTYIP